MYNVVGVNSVIGAEIDEISPSKENTTFHSDMPIQLTHFDFVG